MGKDKQYKHLFQFLVLVLLAAITVACNDNSLLTASNVGAITKENAPSIAVGVTDGVSASYSSKEFNEIVTAMVAVIDNRDVNLDTIAGTCATNPGTITLPTGLAESGTISGTLTFSQFCLAGGALTGDVVFGGDADFEITYDQSSTISKLSLQLADVTITENGYTVTMNGTVSQEGGQLSTTLTIGYTGSDGRQYEAVNLYKNGEYSSGYTVVGGTISDPDYGKFDIKTQSQAPMFYNCSNGKPISGTLMVTDSVNNEMDVNYDSCSSYTVCLNGGTTCDSYNW